MGKKLIIKGADFSENGILPSELVCTQLTLTEGDWSGNYNNGALINKAGGYWTSNAVDVSSYSYVKATPSFKTDKAIILFYSASPTKSNATSLYVGGGEYGIDTPVKIPNSANYVIFMDGRSTSPYPGTGVTAYACNVE
jgi:hypothetical protein